MKECASLALVLALCSTSLAIDLSENDPARSLLQQCQSSFLCRCSHCLHTLLSCCPLFSVAVHTVFTLSCPAVLSSLSLFTLSSHSPVLLSSFLCHCSHSLHTLLSFCPLFSAAVYTVFTLSCPSVLSSLSLFILSSHSPVLLSSFLCRCSHCLHTTLLSFCPLFSVAVHTVFTLSCPSVLSSLSLFTLSSHSPVLLSSFLCCCSHCLHTLRSFCPLFSVAVHTVFTLLSCPSVLSSLPLFTLSSHSPVLLSSLLSRCSHCLHTLLSFCPLFSLAVHTVFTLSSHSPVLLSSFFCRCSHCLHTTLLSFCPHFSIAVHTVFTLSCPSVLFSLSLFTLSSHYSPVLLSFCPLFSVAVHTVFTLLSCPSVLFSLSLFTLSSHSPVLLSSLLCRCSHCLHTLLSVCPLFSVAVRTVFTLSCPSVLSSLPLFTLSSHSPVLLSSLRCRCSHCLHTLLSCCPLFAAAVHTVFTLSCPSVLSSLPLFTLSSHSPVLLSSLLCRCSHCLHTLRSFCPLFSVAVHTVFTLLSCPSVLSSLSLFTLSSHSPVLLSSFLCCCSHCLHTLQSYCPSSYLCGCSLFILGSYYPLYSVTVHASSHSSALLPSYLCHCSHFTISCPTAVLSQSSLFILNNLVSYCPLISINVHTTHSRFLLPSYLCHCSHFTLSCPTAFLFLSLFPLHTLMLVSFVVVVVVGFSSSSLSLFTPRCTPVFYCLLISFKIYNQESCEYPLLMPPNKLSSDLGQSAGHPTGRIIGGTRVVDRCVAPFNAMVALQLLPTNPSLRVTYCSGVMLSADLIVTAALCVYP